ncbi:MAG: hypothetical protein ACYDEB_06190 [Dehalococcoidia bacterium]
MKEQRCFVQFLHPGEEHHPDDGDLKRWNTHPHRRKFMRTAGRYIQDGQRGEGGLLFWGEWEPQSKVLQWIDDPMEDGPRYVYDPYYEVPVAYCGLQNTDPFVFEGFRYSICRQYTKHGPTQLRDIERGSVVLFGSHKRGQFVLDTVLVVAGCVDHNAANYREIPGSRAPRAYADVTLAPLYGSSEPEAKDCNAKPGRSHRLYWGATYDDPVDGMYSFFPCTSYEEHTRGFARPPLELPGIITNGMKQGFKLNRGEDCETLWHRVTRQVTDHGLALGVWAEMPRRLERSRAAA